MKRTQKEIQLFCEEIKLNVAKAILAEEEAEIKQKVDDGEIPIICYDTLARGYFQSQKRIIQTMAAMLNTQKAFETYKQRVEERL